MTTKFNFSAPTQQGQPASFGFSTLTAPTNPMSAALAKPTLGFGGFGTPTPSTAPQPALNPTFKTPTATATSANAPSANLSGTLSSGLSAPKSQTLAFGAIPVSSAFGEIKIGSFTAPATTTGGQKPSLFGNPAATSTSAGGGLGSLAVTTSSAGLTAANKGGFGLNLAAPVAPVTTASGGLTLGGLGGTSSAPPTTSSAVVKGLGGVDPNTSTANANKAAGASGDGKKVKEGDMPNELVETVIKFKEYVKEQKEIGAKISAVSSQQMSKVEEQTKSLKHALSTVTTYQHRNIVALDKLKIQTSQELHNVEMAHRTKETPAGLQYENCAPNQYFQNLLETFDSRMAMYRNLIQDTEDYLMGAQQGASVTPQDLFHCLKKLHETFIALAAQLQGIHEQIKEQKEHYLAYRKIFHNEEMDIFEKRRKAGSDKSKLPRTSQPLGPTPFTGLSNYAAMLMSSAMNRQAPQAQAGAFGGLGAATQPPTAGLFGTNTGFGFGSNPQPTSLFGTAAANTAAKPLGFGFGSTAATTAPSAFGFPSATTSTAVSKPAGFGFGSTPAASTSTTFGFACNPVAKPTGFGFGSSGAFGSTPAQSSTTLFGAPKPLGIAAPNPGLASSAPGFTLQPVPNKRANNFDTVN